MLCQMAGTPGGEAWALFWPASLLGAAAYAALFLLVGTIFRHGTIISLAYWFFLEVLFGNMPGIIKRISVAFYVRSMIYDAGAERRSASSAAREMASAGQRRHAHRVASATEGLLVADRGVHAREYRM
jgi:hypothetical protein